MKFQDVEKYRMMEGAFKSNPGDNYGAFFIRHSHTKKSFKVICAPSDTEWQHVSVSLPNRCPTWEEMCFIKDLFFEDHEVVVQFHPAKKEYVNNHPFCLHLWRNTRIDFPTPSSILVGLKSGKGGNAGEDAELKPGDIKILTMGGASTSTGTGSDAPGGSAGSGEPPRGTIIIEDLYK